MRLSLRVLFVLAPSHFNPFVPPSSHGGKANWSPAVDSPFLSLLTLGDFFLFFILIGIKLPITQHVEQGREGGQPSGLRDSRLIRGSSSI